MTIDEKDRGVAIGKSGERVKAAKEFLKKKFNATMQIKTKRADIYQNHGGGFSGPAVIEIPPEAQKMADETQSLSDAAVTESSDEKKE
jgi:transcription antitermination factor NusA-like protein